MGYCEVMETYEVGPSCRKWVLGLWPCGIYLVFISSLSFSLPSPTSSLAVMRYAGMYLRGYMPAHLLP